MAIVLDSTATSTDQTAGPITWNHTVGGGASSLLVVGKLIRLFQPFDDLRLRAVIPNLFC